MTFAIDRLNKTELSHLAEEVKLDEDLDYFCNWVLARDPSGKLIAVAGVNMLRYPVPKFEHILISPKYQKSKLFVVMLKKLEEYIKARGHRGYISFILNKNKHIQDYAIKYGMRPYDIKFNGIWFEKQIGG
jgi:hypothetical protein